MRSKIQKSGVKRQKAIGNRNAGCGMEVRKEMGVRSKVKGQDFHLAKLFLKLYFKYKEYPTFQANLQ